jgi:hypothetical protein
MSQQINLFNPVFLTRKRQFSALAMAQALAFLLLGALAMYAFEVKQNSTLRGVLAESDKQVESRRGQLVRFSKDFSEQGASRALGDELARTEGRLQDRRALLDDVRSGAGGDTQGYARFLVALARQQTQGVWLVGVDAGGKANELRITGRALGSGLVPAYIRALNREPALSGRRVGALELAAKEAPAAARAGGASREPARYIEFSLSIPFGGVGASDSGGKS